MPTHQTDRRLLVTRRAIEDIVRSATLGSYGVAGFAAPFPERLLGRLGLTAPGIRVLARDGDLSLELDLVVSHVLPIAEVARQVDSAIRYAVRRALRREIASIAIHVERLRFETSGATPAAASAPAPATETSGAGTPGGASKAPGSGDTDPA